MSPFITNIFNPCTLQYGSRLSRDVYNELSILIVKGSVYCNITVLKHQVLPYNNHPNLLFASQETILSTHCFFFMLLSFLMFLKGFKWLSETVVIVKQSLVHSLSLTFGSARALMTFPRARSERLMLAPSRKRAPLALVALALSEPAKSIRLILATHTL